METKKDIYNKIANAPKTHNGKHVKLEYEGTLQEEVRIEDGGMAIISALSNKKNVWVGVTSFSEEDPLNHEDMYKLLGNKVKITIETI